MAEYLERGAIMKFPIRKDQCDKHDAPMDDVQQLAVELNHAAQCVAEGYVTWADIRQMLKAYGVETALE